MANPVPAGGARKLTWSERQAFVKKQTGEEHSYEYKFSSPNDETRPSPPNSSEPPITA
ncbi:hypothetical protein BV22DRAFT_1034526 [Leucogyrophana mollusca]|uniref:Uncharacterized protein n=1 Tax=Leucogyrophana mollusca TaxID=85980 RepID=A0ACB8BGZ0_9AGAM|nr:hypothetical protein BV22DRAFT_1034526 [Leucogyrophana mollusca]